MEFQELGLHSNINKAIKDQKYKHPTDIQKKAIPIILAKQDVLGSAQTGTGKTAAFALPIIHHLIHQNIDQKKRKVKALVVTPTRELAIQIDENFKAYSKYTNIKNTVIYGGVSQGTQTKILQSGVDILIATPGRLLDLMGQGFISVSYTHLTLPTIYSV